MIVMSFSGKAAQSERMDQPVFDESREKVTAFDTHRITHRMKVTGNDVGTVMKYSAP